VFPVALETMSTPLISGLTPASTQQVPETQYIATKVPSANQRWAKMYNKCYWTLCDLIRMGLVTIILIANGAESFRAILIFLGVLFAILLYSSVHAHTIRTGRFFGTSIMISVVPVVSRLFMDFIFQHLRFHDYIVHPDRETHYVGFFRVLGYVPMHTDHITEYILSKGTREDIRQRIVAANYYLLCHFQFVLDDDPGCPFDPESVISNIAKRHNEHIHRLNVSEVQRDDFEWEDIREIMDCDSKMSRQSRQSRRRLIHSVMFGVYVLVCSAAVSVKMFVMAWLDHNSVASLLFIIIYVLMTFRLLLIEIRYCRFAFYFYHLLTGLIPLQTNHKLNWRSIEAESIEKVRQIMFGYQDVVSSLNALYSVHGLNEDEVSVIVSFLVYTLPEDGDLEAVQEILEVDGHEVEEVGIYVMLEAN